MRLFTTLAVLGFAAHLQGQVLTNAMLLSPTGFLGTHSIYATNIANNGAFWDWNSSVFTHSNNPANATAVLSFNDYVVNHYDPSWYLVPYGAAFSPATYSTFTQLPFSGLNPQFVSIPYNQSFYLGVRYTDSFNVAFAWCEMISSSSGLTMPSSGLASGSSGVYVGTLTLVPEPGALSLLGLAGIALALARCRQKR